MEKLDVLVVGAGAVGLAIARTFALAGREVAVLEQHKGFGMETSSRNSEVIHAGIYYSPGSLKARFCVAGKQRLYDYCAERAIPHKQVGKLIVAADEAQRSVLGRYQNLGLANGVENLRLLDAAELQQMEPAVKAEAALWSPSTGIIDSHQLMLSWIADVESRGGFVAYQSPVLGGNCCSTGIELEIGGDASCKLTCRTLINAAGHGAQSLSRALGVSAEEIPPQYYAKGHYFSLSGKPPFNHLVYPVPNEAGLGVHVGLDLSGRVRFGPDVQWVDGLDYRFDEMRKGAFVSAIKKYYPSLDPHALMPDCTGIRPKIVGEYSAPADFCIQTKVNHGLNGLINLYGIESPGLTAAMAIGQYVVELDKSLH